MVNQLSAVRQEIAKTTWPSPREAALIAAMVVVLTIGGGLLLALVDYVFGYAGRLILGV